MFAGIKYRDSSGDSALLDRVKDTLRYTRSARYFTGRIES